MFSSFSSTSAAIATSALLETRGISLSLSLLQGHKGRACQELGWCVWEGAALRILVVCDNGLPKVDFGRTACVFPRRPTTAWRVSWSQSQSRLHPQVPRHFFQCNELKMTCVYALYCVIHLTFEISHDTLAWSGARIDVTRQTSDNHTNIWGSL